VRQPPGESSKSRNNAELSAAAALRPAPGRIFKKTQQRGIISAARRSFRPARSTKKTHEYEEKKVSVTCVARQRTSRLLFFLRQRQRTSRLLFFFGPERSGTNAVLRQIIQRCCVLPDLMVHCGGSYAPSHRWSAVERGPPFAPDRGSGIIFNCEDSVAGVIFSPPPPRTGG
jgi:hypothetical protein